MIEIFSPDNKQRLKLDVDDSSFRSKKLMEDNVLSLEFSATNTIDFEEGCWCMFKQEKYTLLKKENFKKLSERNFAYSLLLDAEQGKTKDVKYKLFTLTRNAGQPPIVDSSPKISFPLVGTPREFMQLMADNMNIANDETGWLVGDCIEAEPILIDFNDMYCFDVLGILADRFKTEWEIESVGDKKLMHLCKIEKLKDSAINLGYGYGMGFEPGLGRSNYDFKVINRLYINSSDRNIDFKTYGNTNLLMPKNKVIEHEGIKYKTDAGGSYIERAERKGRVREGSLDVSEIYPMREGTVTAIDEVSFAKGIYYIYDNTIPETLNFSKCIIPGTTMNIIFQTGDLTGVELDASYNHLKRRIEVIQKTNNGISYPDKSLIPRVGDKYGLFNIKLPQDYINDAEEKALNKAVENLYESEKPKYTFYGTLDKFFAEKRWGDIGGFLNVSYYVRFFDPDFLPNGELIRIVEVKEYVNRPTQPEISLANNVSGKSYTNQQNKLNNQEQTIDRAKKETIDYAKRGWKDTQELIAAVKGMVDDFENSRLSADVFEGMMALFGSASLQFQFLADNWITAISPFISYDPATKQIKCGASKIQHMTMGIDSVQPGRDVSKYKFWTAPEYISAVLTDSDQPYFLYLKASQTFKNIGGRNVGEATFFISKDKIKMDDVPDYHTLWVGYLNSENMEGDRSFRTMYGYTEILPGQITVDKLLSTSGALVIDLLNGVISARNGAIIQGNIKFLSNSGNYQDVGEALDQTNEKIDNLQLGVDNLIYNSKVILANSSNSEWESARSLYVKNGTTYSIRIGDIVNKKGSPSVYEIQFYNPGSNELIEKFQLTQNNKTITFTANNEYYDDECELLFYAGRENDTGNIVEYHEVMMVEGNTLPVSWTPSRLELENQIKQTKKDADQAKQDASKAQSTANNAKTTADAATGRLNNWASDSIISPTEKTALRQQMADIQSEYQDIASQASKYGLTTSSEWAAYYSGYNLAVSAFTKYTATSPENIAVASDYNNISAYYPKRQSILDKIATAAKQYAENLVNNINIGGRNYLCSSRFDNINGWYDSEGNVSVYNDPNFNNVIRYQRLSGTGNFQKVFTVAEKASLANTDLVFYVIAKRTSGNFKFGGWSQTVNKLDSDTANKRDLGNGWVQYWVTFKSGSTIGDGVFGLNSITGAWLFYAAGVLKGNKFTDWSIAPEDVQKGIDEAKQDASKAQSTANTANQNVSNLNTYVDGAFKDGVIDNAEAKAIEKYLNTLDETMSQVEATYNKLYTNSYLEGAAKTNLLNAKVNLFGARDNLKASINKAIADGKATATEKADVDAKFKTFNAYLKNFQSAVGDANRAIQNKLDSLSTDKVNNIQVGVLNLLPESKLITAASINDVRNIERKLYIKNGVTYTIRIGNIINKKGSPSVYEIEFYNYGQDEYADKFQFTQANKTITFTANNEFYDDECELLFYAGRETDTGNIVEYREVMVVEGNKVNISSWMPSISEIEANTDKANKELANIADDNLLTPGEKQDVLKEWQIIQSEKPTYNQMANTYALSTATLDATYNNLNAYITPLLANMTRNSTINGADFRNKFKAYYDAKTVLLNQITAKAKQIADDAKNTALRKVRYIRDWMNGSSANTDNHWVELQAIDNSGVNRALNKPVTSNAALSNANLLTDGNTASNPYVQGVRNTLQYVQVDLQAVYDISHVNIWHYYADGRVYKATKTEVSADGINWLTIFDSSLESTYKETTTGRTYYVKDYQNVTAAMKELAYIKEAIANRTEIDGGLLLTVLLKLGLFSGNTFIEKAGINGAAKNANDVVAWFGGTLQQAIQNLASIAFRMDGSGQLAKGNIKWDALGDIIASGKFQSNKDGYRTVIDPATRSFKQIAENNTVVAELRQYSNGDYDYGAVLNMQNNGSSSSRVSPYDYAFSDSKTNKVFRFTLLDGVGGYPQGLYMGDRNDINNNKPTKPRFYINPYASNGNLKVNLKNLPKTSYGLEDGDLWLNNGKPDIYQEK